MANFNKVILAGNIVTDPELRVLPGSQTNVTEFRMAVNRKFKTQSGEQREEAMFIDCTAFGSQADTIKKWCTKGKPILIEGRLRYDTWEKDGQKRSKHSIVVENFQFIGSREGGGGPGGGGGGGPDYNRPFKASEVTRKAVITFKPEPQFTEEARKNNVTGLVKLRLLLSSSGSVGNISVVKGLPDGLTERAIAAARQIRFQPAEKDGRKVSQYIVIEYNFNIY